jgi:hypothetical protein
MMLGETYICIDRASPKCKSMAGGAELALTTSSMLRMISTRDRGKH